VPTYPALAVAQAAGRRTMGTPMTFRTASGKQIIVITNGLGREAHLSAFALE